MSLSQMQVFNQYIMPATIESLAQMVEKFNAASNGAFRLTTEGFDGDFFQESFFASVHSAQRRVDRYASNTSASATDLTQNLANAVKVAGGFGPIRFEPSQLTWLQKPTAEGIEVASRNFAQAMLKDQLNTAIAGLVAATRNQAGAWFNAGAAVSQGAINSGHALFGDASSRIVADVMTGSVFHKLLGQNITNANNLFVAGDVTVVDILGRAIVVTDAPALSISEGGADYDAILGLADSAAIVYDAGDIVSNIETVNGKLRIETTMQVDYSFGLRLKGYSWDATNGGKSPTDAELATGSNWDKCVTSIKDTAGVVVLGTA
jgi:hypothetical protein